MIGRIKGTILEKNPPEIVVDVAGIGYEIAMPMTCFYELPDLGQEVVIFTHFVVREDAQLLYGFNSKQERALFRELIKVNGVGPKSALGILSGVSASEFVMAIEAEDLKTLTKLPGVGKKTAERLIIEMKDRFKGLKGELFSQHSLLPAKDNVQTRPSDAEEEAVSALIALGYRPQEASRMVSKVVRSGVDSETLIREALRATL